MSKLLRWRALSAKILWICPYAAVAAALPLFAAPFLAGNGPRAQLLAASLSDQGTVLALAGVMFLLARLLIRRIERNADDIVMMVAAATADSMRAHLEPDSRWRLNLIKEVADHINDDNAIALAAIEGTVLDLGKRFAEMQAELDQLRRGH